MTIRVLFTEQEIRERIAQLAAEINRDYTNCEEIHLVGVAIGAMIFMSDLARKISRPMTMDVIRPSSYGSDTKSSGKVSSLMGLKEPLTDRHVLLVEDIIDTGNTMAFLKNYFAKQHPASLKVCTLLDKPSRREVTEIQPDYCGFKIPNRFVMGYGLDYDNGRCRNWPYIGCVDDGEAALS